MRSIPSPLYGVTVDDISNLSSIDSGLKALPKMPTTRVVFDWNGSKAPQASEYKTALEELNPASYIMGELMDSDYAKDATNAAFSAYVAQFVSQFGSLVDIWEVGNESNGNWLGSLTNVLEKIETGASIVKAAGGKVALTLYLNDPNSKAPYTAAGPDGKNEPTPVAFSETIPVAARDQIDYLLLSFYETDFNSVRPTAAWFDGYFTALGELYPNAQLGFGEVGMDNAASSKTLAKAELIMAYYYSLKITAPRYCGGYFWWYGSEDCFTGKKLLASNLVAAFNAEAAALA